MTVAFLFFGFILVGKGVVVLGFCSRYSRQRNERGRTGSSGLGLLYHGVSF